MSKKSRKSQEQQPKYTFTDTTWEAVLGSGYNAQNVAYDFGASNSIVPTMVSFRADNLRRLIGETRQQLAEVETLEAEVSYLESPRYTRDLLAGWWKRNSAVAVYVASMLAVVVVVSASLIR